MRRRLFYLGFFVLMCISITSHAFDPLPNECDGKCSNEEDCLSCMDSCETYIAKYADLGEVLEGILKRENLSHPDLDPEAIANLELCWCAACCDLDYAGDASHPCIFSCPCTSSSATSTTYPSGVDEKPVPFAVSLDEIKKTVNTFICMLLNILWMVAGSIAALVLILSGSEYVTAGDPVKRQKARSRIINALTGLVIVISLCPLVDYLIAGTDITPFEESCKCYEPLTKSLTPVAVTTTTTTPAGPPDLVVDDVAIYGETIGYKLKNTGNSFAGESSSSLYIDGVHVESHHVSGMAEFSVMSRKFDHSWTCYGDEDEIRVCADTDDDVKEGNEDNNCETRVISCQATPTAATTTTAGGPTTSSTTTTSATTTTTLDCSPPYEPNKWNSNNAALKCNNCYNYGCDKRTDNFAQPGYASGSMYSSFTCSAVITAAERDGLDFLGTSDSSCTGCTHKVALVVAPGQDYHWYRKDDNDYWSHKLGNTPVTDKDNAGNKITSPETASRGYYTAFCGYFCVDKIVVNIRGPYNCPY